MRRVAWLLLFALPLAGCHSPEAPAPRVTPADAPAAIEDDTDPSLDPPPYDRPTPEQLHETSRRAFRTLMAAAADGDEQALAILNENFARYEISSIERADLAELFGKLRYVPAARHLAESVAAASMNLGWAAHLSLCQLFPDARRDFPTPEATADYWLAWLDAHAVDRAGR